MEYKHKIYFAVLGILVLAVVSLLILYYTQDFQESLSFKTDVSFSEIEYDYSGDYINYISGEIGSVKLANEGIFEQIYEFPNFVGCVILKGGSSISLYQDTARIYLSSGTGIKNELATSYRNDNKISVGVNEEENFDIIARWSIHSNKISLKELEDNVESVEIYQVGEAAENPFSADYYSIYRRQTCNDLGLTEDPVAVIDVVF